MTDWQLTGSAPIELSAARRELHAAVQVVSSAGRALLPARADHSHTSLTWSDDLGGFLGEPLPPDQLRAGLDVTCLALCVVERDGRRTAELALEGQWLPDATAWLSRQLAKRLGGDVQIPPAELPDALAAERGPHSPFQRHAAAAELARYYSNASHVLMEWSTASTPIRTWPHHFDIAVLLPGPRDGLTIGTGMSPGDGSYGAPYWYVTPWPYPPANALAPLSDGGTWHTAGWIGAVLTGMRLRHDGAAEQRDQVAGFIRGAVAASRAALGGAPE